MPALLAAADDSLAAYACSSPQPSSASPAPIACPASYGDYAAPQDVPTAEIADTLTQVLLSPSQGGFLGFRGNP